MKHLFYLLFFVGACASANASKDFDLVIRGGRVIDGTGNPAYFADVGVKDGTIAAIGRIGGSAEIELDATGYIVAPGFIDVHTHAENVQRLPLAENFLRMGVTSVIIGNCGSSRLDLDSYFRALDELDISVNVASLIGHSTIRRRVIGPNTNRAPTDEELEEMRQWVDRAMRAGAVGLSTGLIYQPGTFATTDEIVALAKVAAKYDGVYASHMRDEGREIIEAIGELITIVREAKLRGHISHIKLSGNTVWGRGQEILELIDSSRREGLDITQDQYMYPASSTHIRQLIPSWAREGGREEYRERIADPEIKERIVGEMITYLERSGRQDFSYAAIASFQSDPSLNGLRIPQAAKQIYRSDDLFAQIDLILEIESRGGASGVFHSMSEQDVQIFLQHPNTMFASDSGVRDPNATGMVHPRGHGNSARVLANYVREENLLGLEDAVRRMTSLPAATFRLKDRGHLREGFAADIVVFDPAKVQDNATFEVPREYSTGFRYVLVNGERVIVDDEHTGATPGVVLRHRSEL